jgi:DNA-binding transcriptional LysR family regulator
MAFNLRLLRVFLAVARHQSVTRAAADLGLTQPAVSRAMRELETQTRSVLLERTPSGVRLTEAGEALLGHARVIFAEARAAEEDLQALSGLAQGTLRIGGSPTVATYILPPLLAAFHARYPGVEFRLTTAPSREIVRALIDRDVEIALVETPIENPRTEAQVWAYDELVLIAAPRHPIVSRAPVKAAALAHELLVIREPGSGTFDTIMAALRTHGVVPQRRLEVDTAEGIVQLVAAGIGVAIVSRCSATDALALGHVAVVDVEGLALRRPLMRVRLTAAGESAAARAFGSILDTATPPGVAKPQKRSNSKRALTATAP